MNLFLKDTLLDALAKAGRSRKQNRAERHWVIRSSKTHAGLDFHGVGAESMGGVGPQEGECPGGLGHPAESS